MQWIVFKRVQLRTFLFNFKTLSIYYNYVVFDLSGVGVITPSGVINQFQSFSFSFSFFGFSEKYSADSPLVSPQNEP